MVEFVSVDGSPDEVRGTGAQIKALGATLDAKAQQLVSDINTKETGAPWGGDHFGEEFKKGYFQTPEGSDKPFNEALKDELGDVGDRINRIGDGIMGAMNDYQLTDGTNSQTISTVNKD